MTATPAEWQKTKGRNGIFATGKAVAIKTKQHDLILPVLDNNARGSGCCTSDNPASLNQDREILDPVKSGR